MTVEFRILGDVEVRVDGRRLEIDQPRQRCVLAALLVDVNRCVPAEQLVVRLWSDRPPYSARSSLASHISRLRRVLAGVDGVAISNSPGGYTLAADALSVDLHRFRQLVAHARTTPDAVAAAALFDRSFELWNGAPFTSLNTPWVNELRDALVVERHSVELDRNDAALRAGRHAELLVQLAAEQAAHPLDERLAGQLMLAQYRCGRQADALDTYRQVRERLVEELGVDPGQLLRRVQQQILAGETEEPVIERGRSREPPRRAVERPDAGLARRVTSFVARHQELCGVVDALREGPLVTLTGVGGVGKTRLALEVARGHERSGGGVWVCELAPLEHGEAVGHAVAVAVGLRQQPGPDVEQSVIEYLQAHEGLLLVDNCEHVVAAAAGFVEQVVRRCPRVSVLATSRQPLGIEGERIVEIPPLSVEDATRLFAERARACRPEFTLDDQPTGAVADVCRRVDCLPLGVELAAARMRVMSAADVARRLDQLHHLPGGVRGAVPRQQSLTATIEWSYRLLTESEQAFFARLSVFAGSFDLEAAHGVCGADGAGEGETLELLAGLVDKSMVTVRSATQRTRYGVLDTLRAYGRERLQDQGVADRYSMRHAVYFTELAERSAVGLQGAQERDWVERMLPDYDNLRAVFEHAMTDGEIDLALRLVASASELVALRVGYEVSDWAERVAAAANPDHPLFATVIGTAARGAYRHGDFVNARRLGALADGRVPGRGAARFAYPADVVADVALMEGDLSAIHGYWESEAARARRDGDPIRLVHTTCVLALSCRALGDLDAALPAAREAAEVADTTANPTARSSAYLTLGYLLKKPEPERALALLEEAARLAEAVQNFWWYGGALMEAAATRAVHGDPATAAATFVEVLDHWDRVGAWASQWACLRYVARFLVRLGADDTAIVLHFALLRAGRAAPLNAAQLEALAERLGQHRVEAHRASPADGPTALVRARSSLQVYLGQA
jgi:predicted ATPase/DNA-binding SARP family transcriptional activator